MRRCLNASCLKLVIFDILAMVNGSVIYSSRVAFVGRNIIYVNLC